ncbi:MAG: hypothetical protein F4Y39_12255 [Gemmatimonadetes bacterium]|nr:hypothetical protein [Gemmatimonadota bacterium]MYF75042.1 hypothetical protein [Gemmatimonadota bacterium]MYK53588.1 hypothetical protein [Gemmatimonadota bacterium]
MSQRDMKTNNSNMKATAAQTIDHIKKQIAESEGFPTEKIDEFVVFIQNDPYITSAGLQYKMLQTYKAGKFAVQAVMPSKEEYALLRRMMGLKDEEPLVVMRGEVWVEGLARPFVDYGTTTPNNLKGFVRFSDYPLEMATRRATNRAMRLATATGMCSVDELQVATDAASDVGEEYNSSSATQSQIDLIKNLGRSPRLTERERERLKTQIEGGLDKRQASELIQKIKARLDARRKADAQPIAA